MTDQPEFLITTDDILSKADAEQLREDIQITPRPLPLGLTTGMTAAAVSTALAGALEQLLATRILCLGCVIDHRNATLAGTPEAQLPDVAVAQVVVNGMGQCLGHVQFTDAPVLPGQTPGGLWLATPGA